MDTSHVEYDVELLEDVIKGKSDWRCYRALRLRNGVTCVLVNDKESKTTAMSVCVNAGASSDPRELSGLAHFTEHMCFLGSEKYRGENEYKRYLSCHGGRSNASTSMSFTTYKFDVLAEHAHDAVDIFSNFFVSPLFTESGTSREVNAVDSENSKNLVNDGRRRLQILKALADPNHHWSKFSTGNALTLLAESNASDGKENSSTELTTNASQMREALMAFHKRHYRPSNMTAVIVGPQPLDTLQDWIVPRFSPIVDRWAEREASGDLTDIERIIDAAADDAPANGFGLPEPPHNPAFFPELQGGKWPVLLTTLPLRSLRKLVLMFPLPSVQNVPDRSPISIISHLIGHEGPGSSFAVLQDAGLLNSLSAGPRISAPDQCLFQIDIGLTEEGEARWKEVVAVVFEHCRLIASTAAAAKKYETNNGDDASAYRELARIWEEVSKLRAMHFHQTSPGQAYDFAPHLSQSIVINGVKKCLSAGSMLDETTESFPLQSLADFAARLVPQNCIVERCSQAAWDEQKTQEQKDDKNANNVEQFGLKKEKWYGVSYHLSEILPSDVSKWEQDRKIEGKEYSHGSPKEENTSPQIGVVHLPRPNQYIPRSLDLCPDLPEEAKAWPRIEKNITPPNLCVNDNIKGRLWHRLDDRYALPKSNLTLLLRNPAVENRYVDENGCWEYSSGADMQSLLLTGAFSDAMAQDTYDATLAGLYWSLVKSSSGITLNCSGYSDRLSDLALKLLREFLLPSTSECSFLKESHFNAAKDRTIRSLQSFFQSRRADSHAMYYRDLLMSSKGKGIDDSLSAVESATFATVVDQHKRILANCMGFECLFSGNVSESEAKSFFSGACNILQEARTLLEPASTKYSLDDRTFSWVPGPFARRLDSGSDVEIHFASKNPEEQNGAVLVTYQSQVPGFRGQFLSSEESRKYTAAIRVLCHMLREPLFDELRTKQQLGYIVDSYYDVDFSTYTPNRSDQYSDPVSANYVSNTIPIDFIVVNIMSRKVSPPEVLARLDDFLGKFRHTLTKMPESEIRDHADALSKKLLKPIQKLGVEASMHFGKIKRFAPEVLGNGGSAMDLPWESVEILAREVKNVQRKDVLEVWDSVVADTTRSRVVSCVYGNTFPLGASAPGLDKGRSHGHSMVHSLDDIFHRRSLLQPYDLKKRAKEQGILNKLVHRLGGKRNASIAALALIGGTVGLCMMSKGKRERGQQK